MNGDECRRVLGDLTNRPIKRGFSSILHGVGAKSFDVDPPPAKHVRLELQVQNLVRNKFTAKHTETRTPNSSDEELNPEKGNDQGIQIHEVVHVDDDSVGGSKNLDLVRCKSLNVSQVPDPLNGCSCSFCLKAAYIWSDLHYQDFKGRISALKKSQKEAAALAQKCGNSKDFMAVNASGSLIEPSKLEGDLMNQWRNLFLHMEGVLINENNQLQADYTALKDMRENCRIDLETINKEPEDRD